MRWNTIEVQSLGERCIADSAPPLGTAITCQVFTNPDLLQFNVVRGKHAGAIGVSREALEDTGETAAGLALNELLSLITDERLPAYTAGPVPLLAVLTSTGWSRLRGKDDQL